MTMNGRMVGPLFYLAALYDGVLGVAFVVNPGSVYTAFGVTPPNHWGYVQFPAALLLVFALMYLAVARNPEGNRNLIPYGIMLKVAYCAVVFGYWFTTDLPGMWKPFAVIDLVFLGLFIWAYVGIAPAAAPRSASA
jgi:hypothetical protein